MSRAQSLQSGLTQLTGWEPQDWQVQKLRSYLDLLEHWNKAYNLTAVRDRAGMITRHLLDSLSVLPWIDFGSLLDAGSGAGLPGIPLAIARPGMEVTLLDSAGKKIRFLNHVCRELELQNAEPVQARLESYQPGMDCEGIISRAFSDLAEFVLAAKHLVVESTRLLAMKGRYPKVELRALPAWIRVDSVEKLSVPGLQEDRHLVIMSVNA